MDVLGDAVAVAMAMADVVVIMVMVVDAIPNNDSNKATPNASGFYPMVEWNKLSFEECDKIQKEHDKKGEPGRTKHIIGDISIEHVTTPPNVDANATFNMLTTPWL